MKVNKESNNQSPSLLVSMEEVQKIKPYIAHLNKQLKSLKPDLDKMTAKPLDEQLLLLNDERSRLDLTNKYSYVLSSLMFAYMKVLDVKDMSPIMNELTRVKTYMDKAKSLDQRLEKKAERHQSEQKEAKAALHSVLDGNHKEPSISRVNFQGKHTKFDDEPSGLAKEVDIPNGQNIVEKIKESKSRQKKVVDKKKSKSKLPSHKVSKRK